MYWKSVAIALALSSAVSLEAQQGAASPLSGPQVGVVHVPDGSLRAVYGIPANFLYGATLGRGVNAAAFSSTSGLVWRVGQIDYLAVDGTALGSYATNEPSPLLADGSGSQAGPGAALAWLPSSKQLLSWSGGTLTQVQIESLPGAVISLSPAAARGFADLLVAAADGGVDRLTVALATGQVTEMITVSGAKGAAYEQNGFLLLPGADGLQVRFPDGRQQVFGIKTVAVRFEAVSDEWVHLSATEPGATAASHWLLHLDGAAQGEAPLQLSGLPAAPQRAPRIMPRQVGNTTVRVAQ